MRILTVGNMYPPHHLGGYELAWESWVRHAESEGHEVRVLTTDTLIHADGLPSSVDPDRVFRQLRWYWRDHEFPRIGLLARWRIERQNERTFDRHLRDFRPAVVVWWAMAGMSISCIEQTRRARIPSVAMLCDYWLQYAPSVDAWLRAFARRPRLADLVERVTGTITRVDLGQGMTCLFLSDTLRQGAAAKSPAMADSEVIHRGPDIETFAPAPARPWQWRLLYMGRIDRRKGIQTAVESLLELPHAATLTVDGGGDEQHLAELEALIARHGLGARVTFQRSSRRALRATLAEADVLVFPVRWAEPWGLAPLEAMAVGRPVVATGLGGSGEYLEDTRNSLLFDPEAGSEGLADRVRALADNPALRERLIAGGKQTVAALSASKFNRRVLAATERAVTGNAPMYAPTQG